MDKALSVGNFIDVKNGVVAVSPRPIEFNTLLISTDERVQAATPVDVGHIELKSLNYAKALYADHEFIIDLARAYFAGVKYATKTPEKLIIKYFAADSQAGALDTLLAQCKENIQGWNILTFDGLSSEQLIESANWKTSIDDDSILMIARMPKNVVLYGAADPIEALNKVQNILKLATDNVLIQMGVASYFGCLDFDRVGGRVALAYRQLPDIDPEQFSDADYFRAVDNKYNIYAKISANNYTQKSIQDGAITGQYLWADAWAAASWLKASVEQNMLQTFGLNIALPPNTAGFAIIDTVLTPIMQQFGVWGGYSAESDIDEAQEREILQNITQNQYNTLRAKGYVISYSKVSPITRSTRDFIDIYLYWLDAGVMQKVKLYSYEVQ